MIFEFSQNRYKTLVKYTIVGILVIGVIFHFHRLIKSYRFSQSNVFNNANISNIDNNQVNEFMLKYRIYDYDQHKFSDKEYLIGLNDDKDIQIATKYLKKLIGNEVRNTHEMNAMVKRILPGFKLDNILCDTNEDENRIGVIAVTKV